jgi:phospholipid N-methyltransferase
MAVALAHRWQFLKRYIARPGSVGAVAPSSRALAAAICDPLSRRTKPAVVLEIGAGTGAFTRHIGSLLDGGDELDICEVEPEFADIIERNVLTLSEFAPALAEGRVRLMRMPVQDLSPQRRYDFIISGLPLTAFTFRDVRSVFKVIQRSLRPGGVLSYFEYIGLRRISRTVAVGKRRKHIARVSAYLSRAIRNHQFDRQVVVQNLPPAYARHLRFD